MGIVNLCPGLMATAEAAVLPARTGESSPDHEDLMPILRNLVFIPNPMANDGISHPILKLVSTEIPTKLPRPQPRSLQRYILTRLVVIQTPRLATQQLFEHHVGHGDLRPQLKDCENFACFSPLLQRHYVRK